MVSTIASAALLLLLLGSLFLYFRKNGMPDVDNLPTEDLVVAEKPKPVAQKPTTKVMKKK